MVALVHPSGAAATSAAGLVEPQPAPVPPAVTLDPPPVPPAVPEGVDDGSDQPAGEIAAAAVPQTTRAFGRQPYGDVTAAAAQEAVARRSSGCAISDAMLAGTLLAITFTEAGPLASSTSAPSPMTLSRWDTNARLYAFANPSTPYPRAFWHPGVGLWQFDHPWQNTAAERIDTRSAAALAAQVVAGRWCSSPATNDIGRFVDAVAPWHGCDDGATGGVRCLEILAHHHRANGPGLADDTLVDFTLLDGVTRLGGARPTQCRLAGESTARACTFVDPAVAQGNRAWAGSTGMPTPIAAPFYVVRVGAQEWRYWLRADTGYDRDIVAKATIGGNPRTTLVWQNGSGLCDVTSLRGTCVTTSLPSSEPSTPALTSLLPGRLDLFARSSSGALTHRARPAGGSWTTAVGLGGALRSQPAAVAWSAGHVDVFVRGTDDGLWHRGLGSGTWTTWRSFGGGLSSAPAVASTGSGRLDVFVRGTDNALWTRGYMSGRGWTGWRSLGGGLTSSPAAVSWGPDRVAVFVRGTGGRVFQRTRTGSGWSSWIDLGGVGTSAPAVASTGPDGLDLVVRGTDDALWARHAGATPQWTNWTSLGGRFASGPGATATGSAVWLAGRAPGGSVYTSQRAGTSAGWSAWRSIGP